MKKKLAVLAAGICALSLFLTGCSGEISNDYVTITKYKGVEIDKVDADTVSDNDVEDRSTVYFSLNQLQQKLQTVQHKPEIR